MAGPDVQVGDLGRAPVVPLLLIGFGGYFLWFGIHYWRDTATTWPSDPVKSVLQGHGVPAAQRSPSAAAQLSATETAAQAANVPPPSKAGSFITGPEPTGPAVNMAKLLLGRYGWSAAQLAPLLHLWTQESGWSATARNPSSGAFGIAQALGHGQADTAAPDGTNEYGAQFGLTAADARAANSGSALWQIRWGLGYIKARYGSPEAAWSHEQAAGWY